MNVPKSVITNIGKVSKTFELISIARAAVDFPERTGAATDQRLHDLLYEILEMWDGKRSELQQVSSDLKEIYNRVAHPNG